MVPRANNDIWIFKWTKSLWKQ